MSLRDFVQRLGVPQHPQPMADPTVARELRWHFDRIPRWPEASVDTPEWAAFRAECRARGVTVAEFFAWLRQHPHAPALPPSAGEPLYVPESAAPVTAAPTPAPAPAPVAPAKAAPGTEVLLSTTVDPVDGGRIRAAIWKTVGGQPQIATLYRRPADSRWVAVLGNPEPWPRAEILPLGAGVKPTDGERLDGLLQGQGRDLVAFYPQGDRGLAARGFAGPVAVSAFLDPFTDQVRRRAADVLGCRPWEIDMTIAWAAGSDGRPHPDLVTLGRFPALAGAEARVKKAREVITAGFGADTDGWTVEDQPTSATMLLRWGAKPQLPDQVDLVGMLPATISDEWWRLPLGVDQDGRQVEIDLKAGPHSLLVGPTGSGKSVGLVALVAQAFARGFDVVLVDAIKMGVDFVALRSRCSGWADTIPSAQSLLEQVYAEVERRRILCRDHGAPGWTDLPADVRAAEGIRPMLVVVDEYVSTVLPRTVPKGLPKDHPLLEEITEVNIAKAITAELTGRIAREARFVGIHLALAMQRPDAAVISGEMRSNLTSAVQLSKPGSVPSRDALGMVMAADQVVAAAETLQALDDGQHLGLGIIGAEGGSVRGMRVAYAATMRAAERLREIGVPAGRPLRAKPASDDGPDDEPKRKPGRPGFRPSSGLDW